MIKPIQLPDWSMSGPEEGDTIDTSVWVLDEDGEEVIQIVESGDVDEDIELGRRVADALRNAPLLEAYRHLHDGLSDMIEGGRLTEADIPDDYKWLVDSLAAIGSPS